MKIPGRRISHDPDKVKRWGRLNSVQAMYFARLAEEYLAIHNVSRPEQLLPDEQIEALHLTPSERSIQHLEALEIQVFHARSEPVLRHEVGPLLERLDRVLGQVNKFDPAVVRNYPLFDLRAFCESVLRQIYRVVAKTSIQERKRAQLLQQSALITVAVGAVFAIIVVLWYGNQFPIHLPLVAFVIFAGVLGGLIGTFAPISKITIKQDAVLADDELQTAQTSLIIAPISGGFFAMVLLILISGEFLKGDLIPKIVTMPSIDPTMLSRETFNSRDDHASENAYSPLQRMVGTMVPESGKEMAKLLAWCFVAGYVSGFVPNALRRVANTVEKPAS